MPTCPPAQPRLAAVRLFARRLPRRPVGLAWPGRGSGCDPSEKPNERPAARRRSVDPPRCGRPPERDVSVKMQSGSETVRDGVGERPIRSCPSGSGGADLSPRRGLSAIPARMSSQRSQHHDRRRPDATWWGTLLAFAPPAPPSVAGPPLGHGGGWGTQTRPPRDHPLLRACRTPGPRRTSSRRFRTRRGRRSASSTVGRAWLESGRPVLARLSFPRSGGRVGCGDHAAAAVGVKRAS